MEPNRTKYRLMHRALRRQAGVTAIGFLVLASVFGLVGFATLKIVPLYMQKMRVSTVLQDLGRDAATGTPTPQSIRNELEKRFSIEGIDIKRENVKITQVRDGYQVQIQQEQRTPFVADLWFLVVVDEQVEIRR
jgi:Flp pilus assembly protein TadG